VATILLDDVGITFISESVTLRVGAPRVSYRCDLSELWRKPPIVRQIEPE
jgi:hypothetical protein